MCSEYQLRSESDCVHGTQTFFAGQAPRQFCTHGVEFRIPLAPNPIGVAGRNRSSDKSAKKTAGLVTTRAMVQESTMVLSVR